MNHKPKKIRKVDTTMIQLSVIVTIFNKIDVIDLCVNSITAYNGDDIEIILIDDGSTDGSNRAIKKYQTADDRVHIYQKENGGASSARKEGLSYAKGNYVLFVDADDWIDPMELKGVLGIAITGNYDIITSDWIIHDNDTVIYLQDRMEEGVYKKDNNNAWFASHMIYYNNTKDVGINASMNTKIFKKELITDTLKKFPDGVTYAEDDFVTYAAMAKANSIRVTHLKYYHYVMNYNSVSHSLNKWYLRDLNLGYNYFCEAIKGVDNYLEYKKQIEIYIQRALYMGMQKYLGFEQEVSLLWYRINLDTFETGDRLIVYGAGKVGKSIYKQLCDDNRVCITGWVDKQYSKYVNEGLNVDTPDMIRLLEYDDIIIAVENKDLAMKIASGLVSDYGVDRSKIIWKSPENEIDNQLTALL